MFQAWFPAQNLNAGPKGPVQSLAGDEDALLTIARHDLYFTGWGALRLKGTTAFPGLATGFTPDSIQRALQNRSALRAKNPNLLILAEVRYYNAPQGYYPPDSPWWKRDANGQLAHRPEEKDLFLLDYANPDLQASVASQCQALMLTHVVDGCMLDWWSQDDAVHLSLIRKVRTAIGDNALLIVNVNNTVPRLSAPYINGIFMEGFGARYFPDWHTAAENLLWAQSHLCAPAITLLEGWFQTSRNDYALMREVTTLSLTHSNGYVLFGDPNPLPTPDHLHDWYPFWDKTLGKPTGPLAQPGPSHTFLREFEHGTAVFNPPGNGRAHLHFSAQRISAATGLRSRDHDLNGGDGDLYLSGL